jgi:hypothetical protein
VLVFNAIQGIYSTYLEAYNRFAFISLPPAAPIMVRQSGSPLDCVERALLPAGFWELQASGQECPLHTIQVRPKKFKLRRYQLF